MDLLYYSILEDLNFGDKYIYINNSMHIKFSDVNIVDETLFLEINNEVIAILYFDCDMDFTVLSSDTISITLY